MRTLLIEPFGGLAGDMLLAALLDLGRPELALDDLRAFVARLVPGACRLGLAEVTRAGLRAKHLAVETDESQHAPHRHLSDLLAIVAESGLDGRARERSEAALFALARAEAAVHGTSVDEVHFHEVGAVDTLVDVCGAAFALERLGVDALVARPPYAGGGTVRCAHGELPVPAPGTAALLGARPWIPGVGGERLTPTGAALYATWTVDVPAGAALRALALGYGAGTRDPAEGPPNLVRVQLCEDERAAQGGDTVLLLEFNLDDATGEEIGFLVGALRAAGALEAWTQAAQMKKDRPGVIVAALCRPEARAALEAVAFRHSPTLGVRWRSSRERSTCARETLSVELHGRPVRVKVRQRPGARAVERSDLSPEHDDLAALAERTGEPLRALEAQAIEAALRARS